MNCILSFNGWRVPEEASWLRVESRWQEDCGKNAKFFNVSATSHSQEASENMRKSCILSAHGNWGRIETWRRGDDSPGLINAVSTKTAADLSKDII